MRIRPGKTRSLVGGIMAIVVMILGLVMMTSFGGMARGIMLPFMIVWVVISLIGAGLSFYNAFSRHGVSLYEIDVETEGESFCPQCGNPVSEEDQFCRRCGTRLKE